MGFGANPAEALIWTRIDYLRMASRTAASGATGRVRPEAWIGDVTANGEVDRRLDMCLVERMRQALRRRDLYAAPAMRYADPDWAP